MTNKSLAWRFSQLRLPARFLLLPVIAFPDERPPLEAALFVKHLRHNFALMVWRLALWQILHFGRLGLAFMAFILKNLLNAA